MGLFNTTGKSYRSVNNVKNKQILEYTKNGTLLTRTSYKNADEHKLSFTSRSFIVIMTI